MNLHILDFAGKKVVNGFVELIGEPGINGNATQIKAVIKNTAYIDGCMQTSKMEIVFVDNAKYNLATFIQNITTGRRITVLTMEHNGIAYALKATDDDNFVWELSDGTSVRHVIYGDTELKQVDDLRRYSKVITNIGGIEYATTFWNNDKTPLGERIRKVFEKVKSKKTFLVCGENKPYNGKPSMRGFWFICD